LTAALLVALTTCFVQPLSAQEVTAGFTGTVTDPSGAPIPEATITAQDTLRGVPYTTKTNNVGVFDLPRLPVSTFDLTVEAKGFATSVRRGITLEMNQKARVDFQLQVGAVTQEIEVSAAPPLLQTDTMEVGTVITNRINEDLPLATRNYIELTMLAPGTTNPNPSSMTSGLTTASGGRPYVNGNREQSDNFLLDGIDNNQVSDNLVGYTPSVDAIQEFNMISNNAPAEFGNFQGGIVSATIKSGTNQLHGDGFEFLRNDVLNAAQWSDNISNSPKAKSRWNMFGGTVGGPIKKDKLFFFGDYQGERFDFPASVSAINVFTTRERAGDFGEVCPGGFNSAGVCQGGIQLYDPTHVGASGQRALVPNNNLAAAGLTEDAVAKNLFSNTTLYPAPTGPGLTYNQLNASRSADVGDQFDVKIDANITEKDRIFGRASWSRLNNPVTNSFPLSSGNSFDNSPTKSLGLDWTRTISPALVNEVRVGGNYVTTLNGGSTLGLGNVGTQLGIAGANERGPGLPSLQGFKYAASIGNANEGTQENFPSTVLQAEDTLVITHGRHVIHTGFQFFRQRIDPFYAGNYGRTGIINFDGQWTAGPGDNATAGPSTGFPEADFWLGLPDTVERGVDTGTWGQRSSVLAAYVQDDWRATDQLTLNLGLRYETHTPWGEVHNRQANFGMITGTEYFAGQSGCPWSNCNALYNSYNGGFDWQPRIGFAWTPSMFKKKAVIRGAYTTSSYLEGTGTNLRLTLNPPFNLEHSAIYDSLTFPTSTTDQGFSIFAPTPTSTTAPVDFSGAVIRLWNPDVKPSLAQQWNFSTEYQFPRDTVLTLMYLGQHATHLMNPMPYFQRRLVGEAGCTAADAVILSGGTIPTCQSPYLSGNPAMGSNSSPIISQISGTESNANMVYHSLQVILRKRMSQGLQYQVAYTYSKCMTNSIGYYGSWGGQVVPAAAYWQNLYDGQSEWAPCESDVRNLLSSYAVYELPFGHKMHYGNTWNPATNAVLGNWQVSGILQLRGGFPSTVSATDASGTGSRSPRADCLGPPTYPKTPVSTGGILWVSPDSYGPALPGAFGTCSVDGFSGPGLRTFDLSVQKSFPITESKRIEFRSEFINFTNTPIFNVTNTTIGAGFGVINSSQGSRNIQFSLKIYY
jgi:hypothetical protein